MDTPAWILIFFLSFALLFLLILAIILTFRLMKISKEVEKIVIAGQGIAEKTDSIVSNVQNMTSISGLVKTIIGRYNEEKYKHKK